MPWLKQNQPVINWAAQTISMGSSLRPMVATVLTEDQVYWIQEITSPGRSSLPSAALARDGPTAHSERGETRSRIVNASVQLRPPSFGSLQSLCSDCVCRRRRHYCRRRVFKWINFGTTESRIRRTLRHFCHTTEACKACTEPQTPSALSVSPRSGPTNGFSQCHWPRHCVFYY